MAVGQSNVYGQPKALLTLALWGSAQVSVKLSSNFDKMSAVCSTIYAVKYIEITMDPNNVSDHLDP